MVPSLPGSSKPDWLRILLDLLPLGIALSLLVTVAITFGLKWLSCNAFGSGAIVICDGNQNEPVIQPHPTAAPTPIPTVSVTPSQTIGEGVTNTPVSHNNANPALEVHYHIVPTGDCQIVTFGNLHIAQYNCLQPRQSPPQPSPAIASASPSIPPAAATDQPIRPTGTPSNIPISPVTVSLLPPSYTTPSAPPVAIASVTPTVFPIATQIPLPTPADIPIPPPTVQTTETQLVWPTFTPSVTQFVTTPIPTASATPTLNSPTAIASLTPTPAPTASPTQSSTPTQTPAISPTASATALLISATVTASPSATLTVMPTATALQTTTPSMVPTMTNVVRPTPQSGDQWCLPCGTDVIDMIGVSFRDPQLMPLLVPETPWSTLQVAGRRLTRELPLGVELLSDDGRVEFISQPVATSRQGYLYRASGWQGGVTARMVEQSDQTTGRALVAYHMRPTSDLKYSSGAMTIQYVDSRRAGLSQAELVLYLYEPLRYGADITVRVAYSREGAEGRALQARAEAGGVFAEENNTEVAYDSDLTITLIRG